jgi:allene oxide cyclase
MARKIGSVLVALLVGGAAFVLGAASASSGITAATSLTVVEHGTTDKVVDVGKKGDSTGDIYTYHNDLYDETDTTRVGSDSGICIRESPKAGTWECMWTEILPDGQITAEGPYSDSAHTWTYAVTGGTGLYENVRGSVVETVNAKGEFVLAYNLIP